MMNEDDDRMADLVNADPMVFYDCTGPEIVGAIGVSAVISLPLAIIAGVFFGNAMMGMIIYFLIVMGFFYLFLNFLRATRQKYHESWLQERIFLLKSKYSWKTYKYVDKSQRFSKGASSRG